MRRVIRGPNDEESVQGGENGEVVVKGRRCWVGKGEGRGLKDLKRLGEIPGALVNDPFEVRNKEIEVLRNMGLKLACGFFEPAELILSFGPGCSSAECECEMETKMASELLLPSAA